MSFKTILTVTAPELDLSDLRLAADLCENAGAHLATLVIQVAAPPPVGYTTMLTEAWFEERQEDLRRLDAARAEVTAFLAARSIPSDVTAEFPELSWADETIGLRARYADLTIMGPKLLATNTLRAKTIEGTLFFSGRPLLLIPDKDQATLTPRRIAVAWDARFEASRAVREALDLLIAADDVRLVLVDPREEDEGHGVEPGADIATYLARHGVKASVERLPSQGLDVADILRRFTTDFGADMLVMGAYGHSRLRERVFGGVTRSMLDNPPLPIFLAR